MTPIKGLGWKPGRGTNPSAFRASAVLTPQPDVPHKYHFANGWWGDQGATSQCVIYSWLHVAADGPLAQRTLPTRWNPTALYQEGQRLDRTPPWDVDSGLTCDAGAKVMRAHGLVGEYRWIEEFDELLDALVAAPVTCGAWWRQDMFTPQKGGLVTFTGRVAGGHQWVINGFNKQTQMIRHKNSWGRAWGHYGHFYTTFATMREILVAGGAEICVARELLVPR